MRGSKLAYVTSTPPNNTIVLIKIFLYTVLSLSIALFSCLGLGRPVNKQQDNAVSDNASEQLRFERNISTKQQNRRNLKSDAKRQR